MPTKYDVFEVIYEHRHPIKAIGVLKILNKDEREYDNILRLLNELEKEGFLIKTPYGFQAKRVEKTKALYDIIHHCLSNDLNYNEIIDRNLIRFVSAALKAGEVTSKSTKLNPKTLKKYLDILNKNSLALIISANPLRAKVFYNILLNNLLVYFGYKHKAVHKESLDYLGYINKELSIFRRLRKANEPKYKQILEEFEASFIYHSLSLEGNPITLPQTRRIIMDKIIPSNLRSDDVDEVKNYQKALNQMLQDSRNKMPLTVQTILDYHALAMNHNPGMAGKIRKVEVYIRGNPDFRVAEAGEIEGELNKLLEGYNEFIKRNTTLKQALVFAVHLHNEFQHIHPFEDGNSRITRLITFYLLQSKDIPAVDIPFGLLDEYLSYTKGSRKREDSKLYGSLQKITLFNLKKINKKLAEN